MRGLKREDNIIKTGATHAKTCKKEWKILWANEIKGGRWGEEFWEMS